MNKNIKEITPINIKTLYNSKYKDIRFRIAIIIIVFIMLFIGIRKSIFDSSLKDVNYTLKELFLRDLRVFDNLTLNNSEETRIGIESILIFMVIGALIFSFKKGTIGITLGFFLGAIVGLLVNIFYPHLIYLIEFFVKIIQI